MLVLVLLALVPTLGAWSIELRHGLKVFQFEDALGSEVRIDPESRNKRWIFIFTSQESREPSRILMQGLDERFLDDH